MPYPPQTMHLYRLRVPNLAETGRLATECCTDCKYKMYSGWAEIKALAGKVVWIPRS